MAEIENIPKTDIEIVREAVVLLEAVPARQWITGVFTNEFEVCCVIGHYQRLTSKNPEDYSTENCSDMRNRDAGLRGAVERLLGIDPSAINNGSSNMYPQETPKDRSMTALRDIIARVCGPRNDQ